MNPIRVGLVGCGRIASFHLDALKSCASYEIKGVCDTHPEKAEVYAQKYGAKTYPTLTELLKNEKLDLVTLTTPSGLHPSQACEVADAGVACLSEKPFGVFYKDALLAVEHFEKKKIPLFVVKQNRYNPTVSKIYKLLRSGKLGKLYMLQSNVFWQRPQSYYDAANWRGKRNSDGGAFMNQASHYVDLLQWFGGGEVESVHSELATFERKIECEDSGAALIRFKNGVIATLTVSMLTYPENLEGTLTLIAEKATIRIGGKALNRLDVCRVAPGVLDAQVESEFSKLNYEPTSVYGNGHEVYYKELVRFLAEPTHPEAITGKEGLKSLRLLCQIYGDKV